MTTRDERSRALVAAEDFMRALVAGQEYANLPEDVRKRAIAVLRHYPTPGELRSIAENEERAPSDVLRPPLLSSSELNFSVEQRAARHAAMVSSLNLRATHSD